MKKTFPTLILLIIVMTACTTKPLPENVKTTSFSWDTIKRATNEKSKISIRNSNKTLEIKAIKDCGSELTHSIEQKDKLIIKIIEGGDDRCDAGSYYFSYIINFDHEVSKNNLEVYFHDKLIK